MQNYKVRILQDAENDYANASLWYSKQNVKGLSQRFAISIQKTIARITSNPYAFAVRYKEVRIVHTHVFPYSIHYIIDSDTILIIAILFEGRNPNIIKTRL